MCFILPIKIPSGARPRRKIPGIHKCKQNCNICPYVNTCKLVKSTYTEKVVHLSREYNCQSKNLVYLVQCLKCKDHYIGETKNTLKCRFSHHIGYVQRNDQRQATGRHFNREGHLLSDMNITGLETTNTLDEAKRKRRESHWIQEFYLKQKGMNRKR